MYKKEGVCILLFPCNQFKGQEPGSNQAIKEFIMQQGGNFNVFEKVEVNGSNACELYKFLRKNSRLKGNEIGWNFGKFLVSRNGKAIKYFPPQKNPLKISSSILKFL